ncbi:response regulator [Planctomicrobium sp. SH668]|uniref:response regulator n=1 Tax=Planctomicrobium sp. SH668 TaxID=3448126 RepID=UPI003F5C0F93
MQTLTRHQDLVIVGVARWGGEAVTLMEQVAPDVVLLDVEMPEMNGVEATSRIRKQDSDIPIIMFSSLTVQGGNATFEALARGANDYVPKPGGLTNINESVQFIDSELVPRIRFWGEKRRQKTFPPPLPILSSPKTPLHRSPHGSRQGSHVENRRRLSR